MGEFTQKKVITRKAEQVLELLGNLKQMKDFYLVGGTALALQIGHRTSVDLDFFINKKFNPETFLKLLHQNFKNNVKKVETVKGTLHIIFNNTKVSFIEFLYPIIEKDMLSYKGVKIAGIKDIAAMKLSAITGRNTKKDFIDLYFLLKSGYSLKELVSYYYKKFNVGSEIDTMLYKSLLFFDEADLIKAPRLFNPVSWESVKRVITKETLNTFRKKIT